MKKTYGNKKATCTQNPKETLEIYSTQNECLVKLTHTGNIEGKKKLVRRRATYLSTCVNEYWNAGWGRKETVITRERKLWRAMIPNGHCTQKKSRNAYLAPPWRQ